MAPRARANRYQAQGPAQEKHQERQRERDGIELAGGKGGPERAIGDGQQEPAVPEKLQSIFAVQVFLRNHTTTSQTKSPHHIQVADWDSNELDIDRTKGELSASAAAMTPTTGEYSSLPIR